MRLKITHTTKYSYGGQIDYSIQRLLLTPLSFAGQRVESWRVAAPGMEKALQYTDCFGNVAHLANSASTTGGSSITASGVVEVENMAGVVRGLADVVPVQVFLRQTPATRPSEAMLAAARGLDGARSKTLEYLHKLMGLVHKTIAYEAGTTTAHTTGAEAFAQGRGVCQDHSHAMLGLAREAGIPSRYVTGYLLSENLSPAAHAWVEALVPDLGWVGFDAANATCPTDHYVRVACGLDAAGTSPVRGSRKGGAAEHMRVEVVVEPAQQ